MNKNFERFIYLAGALAFAVTTAAAQPLPKIELHRIFAGYSPKLPVGLVEPPDQSGRFFLVQQEGRIVVLQKGVENGQPAEFLNFESRKPHFENGQPQLEEGLLSLAFHPGFKTNGLFYVYYIQQNPRRSVISEMKVATGNPNRADTNSERILLEAPEPSPNHKGGGVAFGPDGYLYIALGDGTAGNDPLGSGQNTSTLMGKILRIDVNQASNKVGSGPNQWNMNYGIPSDNPFVNEPFLNGNGARPEIWAYGFRNPWRYSWDRQTGDLWVGDVGQDLWEEVDLIVKGGNYGWSVREGAHHFKPGPDGAKYIDPVMEYPHLTNLLPQSLFPNHSIGCCVIGGYVYRGKKNPSLQGVYLYGDYALGTIWGFRWQNSKIEEEGILLQQPKNIASFAEDADGELYALTLDATSGDGAIYSISVPQ